MKVSADDPRSQRTRAQLREGLMTLVAKKHFASLTIEDVTQAAGLNRTTFYLHYTGLHELLEDCARSLFAEMRKQIYANTVDPHAAAADMRPFVESVFRHLHSHLDFYRSMLGRQGDPLFRSLFQGLLMELIFEPITGQRSPEAADAQLDMKLQFFTAGFGGVAEWWLENDEPLSVEQASQLVARDILPDYLKLLNG